VVSKLDRLAEQLAALGHPARLSILRYVVQGDAEGTAAGDIQAKLDIPASTLSHHLDRLASAGLIQPRRDGTFIYYRADYAELKGLTDYLWEDCCKRGKPSKDCC
jgi:ArsR family transcriptional regulator, arsenate/arsenite/antimonite-responsive transcriptional repressor